MSGSRRSVALIVSLLLCACSDASAGAPSTSPTSTTMAKPAPLPPCDDLPPMEPDDPLPTNRVDDWRHIRTITDGRPDDVAVLRDGTVWVVGLGDVLVKPYVDKDRGCLATNDTETRGRVWRHDGGTWQLVAPPRTCSDVLSEVEAAEDGSLWVFGLREVKEGEDEPCAARWNGRGWAERTLPSEPDFALAVSDTELWTIHHRYVKDELLGQITQLVKGKALTHKPVPNADVLAGGPGGAVWVAGARGNYRVQVAQWDRRRWQRLPDLALPPLREYTEPWLELDSMVATAPDDVWVVAHMTWNAEDESEPNRQILAHWNGSAWSSRVGKEILPWGGGEIVSDGNDGFWLADPDEGGLAHMTGWHREPVTLPTTDGHRDTNVKLSQRPGSREVWALDEENLWSTNGADE
ncbi:hypothetical protein [Nonomuraea sp. NPDC049758]|uniref:hypothetical protein n=1 Tax=Nonomuraea sp. NPDC049758 TaxID=3154360 RepID=UPI00341F7893